MDCVRIEVRGVGHYGREIDYVCYFWSLYQQKPLKRGRWNYGSQHQSIHSTEWGPVHVSQTSLPW